MNRSIFKFLRKKILEQSTITEIKDETSHFYKIECLGFESTVGFPKNFPSKKIAVGLLVDKLVEMPEFLQKMERIENRKENLKSLLD